MASLAERSRTSIIVVLARTGIEPRSSSLASTHLPRAIGGSPVNRCLTQVFKVVAEVKTRSYDQNEALYNSQLGQNYAAVTE